MKPLTPLVGSKARAYSSLLISFFLFVMPVTPVVAASLHPVRAGYS